MPLVGQILFLPLTVLLLAGKGWCVNALSRANPISTTSRTLAEALKSCVNALNRAILISTWRFVLQLGTAEVVSMPLVGQILFLLRSSWTRSWLCLCVNALSRANPISTDQEHSTQLRNGRVNALSRANPISTEVTDISYNALERCQCP